MYYKSLARLVGTVCQEIHGLPVGLATQIIEENGLRCRLVRIDGDSCMITADCKIDRIGLIVNGGLVTGFRNG
jgi:hypothetical protein